MLQLTSWARAGHLVVKGGQGGRVFGHDRVAKAKAKSTFKPVRLLSLHCPLPRCLAAIGVMEIPNFDPYFPFPIRSWASQIASASSSKISPFLPSLLRAYSTIHRSHHQQSIDCCLAECTQRDIQQVALLSSKKTSKVSITKQSTVYTAHSSTARIPRRYRPSASLRIASLGRIPEKRSRVGWLLGCKAFERMVHGCENAREREDEDAHHGSGRAAGRRREER